MAYMDVINLVLPPTGDRSAHITGHYGEVRAKGPHGGSDFNYIGGQAGINLTHPPVHSPVSGEVIFVGGQYGTVTIRDADGNEHKFLHMDTQTVRVNQVIDAGAQIGTMGGRGPGDPNRYAQHVHYQLKDRHGRALNPEEFWDRTDAPGIAPFSHHTAESSLGKNHMAVLRQRDHGPRVAELQQTLAHLGYRSRDGAPLAADGRFGPSTHAAVEAFQREHGLKIDGVVGNETRRVLAATQTNPFVDKSHPQHPLYGQALRALHTEEDHRRIPHGRHSEHLAGALTTAAANAGLVRIDRVELNTTGTLARAVQVHPMRDEPGLNRSSLAVDTHAALTRTPHHVAGQAGQPVQSPHTQPAPAQPDLQPAQPRMARLAP